MKSQAIYTICLLSLCAGAFAQGPARGPNPRPRYVTLPVKKALTPHDTLVPADSGSIPEFTNTVDGYTVTMVGSDPSIPGQGTTNVPVTLFPVIITISGQVFDPTSNACSTGGAPTNLMMNSPLFSPSAYSLNGISVTTNGVYSDFYRRATFWNYTNSNGVSPAYHLNLPVTLGAAINIDATGYGSIMTGTSGCGSIGIVDLATLDGLLQSYVTTSSVAVFELTNIQMSQGPYDDIIGYHSALGGGAQPYAVTDFDTTGAYGTTTDVTSLSHEMNEMLTDPTGANPAPSWGNIGQVLGCQSILEVADPLTGNVNPLSLNGFTYHLQELAFLSWFYRDNPSTAPSGWYSSNNTFTSPSTPCNATSTSLSLSSTTFPVGTAVTVNVAVAATNGGGTPTGTVTLVQDVGALGNTIATLNLTNGSATATISNFPAGTYGVYADYSGDANFTASFSSPDITVTVGGPATTFNPTSYNFGSQTVGTTSNATNIELTNTGTAALTGISISLTGASPGDFKQVTNNCGTSLAVNAFCYITVEFIPTATGLRTANISVSDNAAGSPQTVALSGTGGGTPAATISPSPLAFGSVATGSSVTLPVTVTNSGSSSLTVTTLGLGGSSYFSWTNVNCGYAISPGGNCTFNVTFKPTAVGSFSATVSVTDNAPNSPQSLSITGSGAGTATATLSPASLTFSSYSLGASSPSQSVTLTNSGTGPLSLASIAIGGSNPGDFSQSNNCGSSVNAGAKCTITVVFKPTAVGARSATVVLTDNAANSPQSVALSGTGLGAPLVSLSPTALPFGNVAIGSSSVSSVTLTNAGSATLSISSVSIAGGPPSSVFTQTNNCGTSLAAGSNCTIAVTYKPTATGASSGSISLADNAAGSPQSVALTGTGVALPVVSLSPTSLTFSSLTIGTSSAAQSVTLSNTGKGALSLSSIAIGGTNAGDFTETNNCGSSLNAGATCTISVVFKPTATGARSATVVLTDNATNSPQSIALSGTGLGLPVVSLSPTSLAFGSVNAGSSSASQSVTLSNTGAGPLTISSVSFSGTNASYFSQTNNCGTSVAAGSNCSISVTFTPTAAGSFTASLSVADNASGSPQTVALTGTGLGAPAVSLSPTSVAFGSSTVGVVSKAQTVTLTNSGTATLTISAIAVGGTNPGDFAQTSNCVTTLSAGAKCTISVTFDAAALGARSGSVTITDNAGNSPQSIALTGTGTSPLTLSATSVNFGNVPSGGKGPNQNLTLTNAGTASISFTSFVLSDTADFTQTNNCGTSLPAGKNCTVTLTFTPKAKKAFSATLTITDSAFGSPQTVTLTGTGQ